MLQDTRPCAILEGRLPRTTVFGLHLVNTTGAPDVLSVAQRLADNGTPLATVKGLNGTEGLLDQVKQISPQTTIIYRSLYTSNGEIDCPTDLDTAPDLAVLAQQWMDSLQQAWAAINADYYELMNECGGSIERQTQFSIEAMKLANQQGRCLLLYSFTAGQPAAEDFIKILPAVEFALQNPCRPGQYHGIAMHGYSFEDGVGLSEADPWMTLRHRQLYAALVSALPEVKNIPFYLTEAGIGGGGFLNMPPCDLVVRDVVQYTYQLEQDPYVRGYNEWSFGAGTRWYDLTPCLEGIGTALITYYNN